MPQLTRVNQTQMHFTDDLSLENFKIIGVAEPETNSDAANKQYVDNRLFGINAKAPVRVASTTNVNLSQIPSSIDVITLDINDRILLKNQDNAIENGLYIYNGTAFIRTSDADNNSEVTAGMFMYVNEGNENADTLWALITNNPINLGTTELNFENIKVNDQVVTTTSYVVREIPSGSVNGSNTVFTLANTPIATTEMVFLNGVLQNPITDYTISNAVITFVNTPNTNEKIRVTYLK